MPAIKEEKKTVFVNVPEGLKAQFAEACSRKRVDQSAAVRAFVGGVADGKICPRCARETDRCGCL